MRKIRIATWNIAGVRKILSTTQFDYDPREDLQYFTNQLRNLNLDIVCYRSCMVASGIVPTQSDHYFCWAELELPG